MYYLQQVRVRMDKSSQDKGTFSARDFCIENLVIQIIKQYKQSSILAYHMIISIRDNQEIK